MVHCPYWTTYHPTNTPRCDSETPLPPRGFAVARWSSQDGEAVVQALKAAIKKPISRPVDQRKLKYRPKAVKTTIGSVTIPDAAQVPLLALSKPEKEPREHTEIQWILLKLGSDMGFDVWAARNDRNTTYKGKSFATMPRMKSNLPLQFDAATNQTIELIDVLWLQGNAIVAAFEVESTTSIYSGLLRMADLVTMQPNINVPLYLVAPDDRREKVMAEVNRPTFSKLSPPLAEICQYISFSVLREQIEQVASVLQYLKPEFLDELSESCEVEEAE